MSQAPQINTDEHIGMEKPTQYFSRSAGKAIDICEMETSHIQRALSLIKRKKFQRDIDQLLMVAFVEELDRREASHEMTLIEEVTGVISHSKISKMLGCEAKFHFSYIDKPDEPPPRAHDMVFGSGIDHAQNEAMKRVMDGQRLPGENDLFSDAAEYMRDHAGDIAEGVREERVDEMIEGIKPVMRLWREDFAVKVFPHAVQEKIVLPIDDFEVEGWLDFRGVCTESVDGGFGKGLEMVADLKIVGDPPRKSGRKKSINDMYSSGQPSFYTEATGIENFEFFSVIRQKTQIQTQRLQATLGKDERRTWVNIARATRKRMRRLIMTGDDPIPNRASSLCSKRYCEHWARCEAKFGAGVQD